MDKRFVFDLTLPEWENWVKERGFPKYRAVQIYQWFVRGVQETSRMKNIPESIRTALSEDFILLGLFVEKEMTSDIDGTKKLSYYNYVVLYYHNICINYKKVHIF